MTSLNCLARSTGQFFGRESFYQHFPLFRTVTNRFATVTKRFAGLLGSLFYCLKFPMSQKRLVLFDEWKFSFSVPQRMKAQISLIRDWSFRQSHKIFQLYAILLSQGYVSMCVWYQWMISLTRDTTFTNVKYIFIWCNSLRYYFQRVYMMSLPKYWVKSFDIGPVSIIKAEKNWICWRLGPRCL